MLLISAMLLRAACYIVREEVPGFGKAMGIVFVVGIVNAIIQLPVLAVMGPGPLTFLVAFVIQVAAMGAIYSAMLPANYGKGIAIAFVQLLIVFAIVFGITTILGAMMVATH
jgi:hypothetical protein